jgi:hypothetical protein
MRVNRSTMVTSMSILLLLIVVVLIAFFSDLSFRGVSYASVAEALSEPTIVRGPKVVHQEMPTEVRAIYMTACYGASSKLRNKLVSLIEQTELNSIIIDIKDYTGTIAVPTKADILQIGQTGSGCKITDIKEFIELLHSKGIYVIGRITVFQDPLYAKHRPDLAVQRASAIGTPWADHKGLSFIDVGAKEFWDYIVALAWESHNELGFDELNFDYVRYPSDGDMSDTYYPHSGGNRSNVNRQEELEKFFIYLHHKMSKPNTYGETPRTSADLFGMTATNYDDLTIGQVLERALPYFDAIAPMVYPSHYPKSFLGLGNPNKHVYKVVNYSMSKAVERTVATETKIAGLAYEPLPIQEGEIQMYSKPSYSADKLRAWIQDFDYGGEYGIAEVNAQIQASRDAGVTGGYMIWDPANRYTRGVIY